MNSIKIGKNIKSMREESNLSQTKVAEYLSLDEDMIIKIENGELDINLDIIQRLSKLFCCRLDQVLFGKNPKIEIVELSELDKLTTEELKSLYPINKIALNQSEMNEMLNKRGWKL